MRIRHVVSSTILALAISTAAASASTIALTSVTGGTLATSGTDQLYGWTFNVLQPLQVTELGAFDTGSDGFAVAHDVGIFSNATQSLLVSATLSSGAGGTLDNGFRYTTVAPTLLGVGSYTIVLTMPQGNSDTQFINVTSFTTASEIQYVNSAFAGSSTLAFPNIFGSFAPGMFGPNFQFDTSAPVPEPATLSLLGLGLAGAGARRWRQRKQQ